MVRNTVRSKILKRRNWWHAQKKRFLIGGFLVFMVAIVGNALLSGGILQSRLLGGPSRITITLPNQGEITIAEVPGENKVILTVDKGMPLDTSIPFFGLWQQNSNWVQTQAGTFPSSVTATATFDNGTTGSCDAPTVTVHELACMVPDPARTITGITLDLGITRPDQVSFDFADTIVFESDGNEVTVGQFGIDTVAFEAPSATFGWDFVNELTHDLNVGPAALTGTITFSNPDLLNEFNYEVVIIHDDQEVSSSQQTGTLDPQALITVPVTHDASQAGVYFFSVTIRNPQGAEVFQQNMDDFTLTDAVKPVITGTAWQDSSPLHYDFNAGSRILGLTVNVENTDHLRDYRAKIQLKRDGVPEGTEIPLGDISRETTSSLTPTTEQITVTRPGTYTGVVRVEDPRGYTREYPLSTALDVQMAELPTATSVTFNETEPLIKDFDRVSTTLSGTVNFTNGDSLSGYSAAVILVKNPGGTTESSVGTPSPENSKEIINEDPNTFADLEVTEAGTYGVRVTITDPNNSTVGETTLGSITLVNATKPTVVSTFEWDIPDAGTMLNATDITTLPLTGTVSFNNPHGLSGYSVELIPLRNGQLMTELATTQRPVPDASPFQIGLLNAQTGYTVNQAGNYGLRVTIIGPGLPAEGVSQDLRDDLVITEAPKPDVEQPFAWEAPVTTELNEEEGITSIPLTGILNFSNDENLTGYTSTVRLVRRLLQDGQPVPGEQMSAEEIPVEPSNRQVRFSVTEPGIYSIEVNIKGTVDDQYDITRTDLGNIEITRATDSFTYSLGQTVQVEGYGRIPYYIILLEEGVNDYSIDIETEGDEPAGITVLWEILNVEPLDDEMDENVADIQLSGEDTLTNLKILPHAIPAKILLQATITTPQETVQEHLMVVTYDPRDVNRSGTFDIADIQKIITELLRHLDTP